MCTYVHICVHMCTYVYICVHMCTYVYICVHMCTYAYICVHMRTYVYICVHMCTYVYICVHMCTYVYICVHCNDANCHHKNHETNILFTRIEPQAGSELQKRWQRSTRSTSLVCNGRNSEKSFDQFDEIIRLRKFVLARWGDLSNPTETKIRPKTIEAKDERKANFWIARHR
jgi:nuclear pore complex protein Nup62